MADHTKIEWTDATWNPITGCSVTSPGCTHCYAMRLAGTRMRNHPSRMGLTIDSKAGPVWNGEVRFNEGWLDQPLRWKRPRMIFVCAHGDLFHESVPDEWIDRVFAVMALCPHHVFQVLTKRSARMRRYVQGLMDGKCGVLTAMSKLGAGSTDANILALWGVDLHDPKGQRRPLPNVWLGVSVEDQTRADERIPDLLAAPAAVRWASNEPALGRVDYTRICLVPQQPGSSRAGIHVNALAGKYVESGMRYIGEWDTDGPYPGDAPTVKLDWIVLGGESGNGARPMHPDWARSVRDQCAAASVPFHFKQWGDWVPQVGAVDGWTIPDNPEISRYEYRDWEGDHWGEPYAKGWQDDVDDDTVSRIGKRLAGRLLDGVQHDGWPAALAHHNQFTNKGGPAA